jgi:hypothetical protein
VRDQSAASCTASAHGYAGCAPSSQTARARTAPQLLRTARIHKEGEGTAAEETLSRSSRPKRLRIKKTSKLRLPTDIKPRYFLARGSAADRGAPARRRCGPSRHPSVARPGAALRSLVEVFARREDLAQMRARPRAERFHCLPQGATKLGQLVVHTLWSSGEDPTLNSFWARPLPTSTLSSSAATRSTPRTLPCSMPRRTFQPAGAPR